MLYIRVFNWSDKPEIRLTFVTLFRITNPKVLKFLIGCVINSNVKIYIRYKTNGGNLCQ